MAFLTPPHLHSATRLGHTEQLYFDQGATMVAQREEKLAQAAAREPEGSQRPEPETVINRAKKMLVVSWKFQKGHVAGVPHCIPPPPKGP